MEQLQNYCYIFCVYSVDIRRQIYQYQTPQYGYWPEKSRLSQALDSIHPFCFSWTATCSSVVTSLPEHVCSLSLSCASCLSNSKSFLFFRKTFDAAACFSFSKIELIEHRFHMLPTMTLCSYRLSIATKTHKL